MSSFERDYAEDCANLSPEELIEEFEDAIRSKGDIRAAICRDVLLTRLKNNK